MEFKAIETQEEFETQIKDRIKRERETAKKEALKGFEDYEDLKTRVANFDAEKAAYEKTINEHSASDAENKKHIGELEEKVKGYESDSVKTRIALELGLPFEIKGRIKGNTEDEIRKDAESLAALIGRQKHSAPPMRSDEGAGDAKASAYKTLLNNLTKKGD